MEETLRRNKKENQIYTSPALLFDDQCPLCVRFKDSLKMLKGTDKINPISIHDEKVYEVFPELDKESCHQYVHYIDAEGKIYAGEDAIEHLIKLFPLVNKFAWLVESNMGKKAVNYFHTMTNNYRKILKKKCPTCTK